MQSCSKQTDDKGLILNRERTRMSIKAFDILYESISLYESIQGLDTLKQKLHAIMAYFPNSMSQMLSHRLNKAKLQRKMLTQTLSTTKSLSLVLVKHLNINLYSQTNLATQTAAAHFLNECLLGASYP